MKKEKSENNAAKKDDLDHKTFYLSRAETTTEVSNGVPSLQAISKFKQQDDGGFLLLQGSQILSTLQIGISENTRRNFSTIPRTQDEEDTDHLSMRKGKKLCCFESQNEVPKQLQMERKQVENQKGLFQTQNMEEVPSTLEVESCDEDSVGSDQVLEEYESHYATEEIEGQSKDIEDIVGEKLEKYAHRYDCEAQLYEEEEESLFGEEAEEELQVDEEEFEYWEPQTNFQEYIEEEEGNALEANNEFKTQEDENQIMLMKARYDDEAPLDQEWEF